MLKWLSKSILGYGAKQFVRHVNPERPLQVVGRLPSEELMGKLPSFLPVLFDAFGNQNAGL